MDAEGFGYLTICIQTRLPLQNNVLIGDGPGKESFKIDEE